MPDPCSIFSLAHYVASAYLRFAKAISPPTYGHHVATYPWQPTLFSLYDTAENSIISLSGLLRTCNFRHLHNSALVFGADSKRKLPTFNL